MPDPQYVLTNKSSSPSVGATLNGCKIKVTGSGAPKAYELYLQNASSYAAKLDGPLPVTFEDVSITQGTTTTTWDITVDDLPNTTDAGSWVTPSALRMNPDDTSTSGEFTAQTGGGVVPEEEAAASAGQGNY